MNSTNDNQFSESPDEWDALAVKAQSGDKKAYTKLLRALVPYIESRLYGKLANHDWVDDITQDILVSVHKSLNTYQSDRPFKPWLGAIIQFRKTDFLRKHYKKKDVLSSVQEKTDIFAENVTYQGDFGELKDIEVALSSLPDKQREIFKLLKIEGYSAKEVAEKMDMSVSAVKVSAHRAGNRLKEMLR